MVEALGLAEKGTAQSERVSPSSLRAWFITSRLYADERVDILQLARATGTSVGQIEERYARLDTREVMIFSLRVLTPLKVHPNMKI